MGNVIAAPVRRLTDLYLTGTSLILNDESDNDPIEVWISKVQPPEQKEAGRKAAASRAAVLAIKNLPDDHPDKVPYFDLFEEGAALGEKERVVEFLLTDELAQVSLSVEAETAAKDKWAKDDLYESLSEAWNSGLNDKWITDPDDKEASRVYELLKEFTEEVENEIEARREGLKKDLMDEDSDVLLKRAVDQLIDTEANIQWLEEFRQWQVYYAVRLPANHTMLYFESKEEVERLDHRIFDRINETYESLVLSSIEGKELGETPSSSE